MSILRRLIRQLKIWLAALMAPAEDPRQTFTHAHRRQRDMLEQVRHARANVAAAKQRLEAKTVAVRDKLPRLEDQAREALLGGREDLARLALQRRQIAIVELQTLEEQVRDVRQEELSLTFTEQRLATQIEAFFARQEVIEARYSAAEAQVHINEALSGVSQELTELGSALQEAEQRAERMQARASAIDQLVEVGILENPDLSTRSAMEREFSQLDIAGAVDDQLEALKRQIGGNEPPPTG